MENSYDEIDIKRILQAMEDANKKPTLYNKSGKPKGYYAEKIKKAKEKPEHEKRKPPVRRGPSQERGSAHQSPPQIFSRNNLGSLHEKRLQPN